MSQDAGPYDVVIVGGGPAGLSAALLLARACRRVIVCDSGQPRNARTQEVHGFLTRDGTAPGEILALGRQEIARYGVEWIDGEATTARREGAHLEVRLRGGAVLQGRRLLIATGVRDRLPSIPGLEGLFGRSVHHCPYCDGWEWRDRALAAYGRGRGGAALALSLRTWSADVVLLTDGRPVPETKAAALAGAGVRVVEDRVLGLEGVGGRLQRVLLAGGSITREALFLATGNREISGVAADLGCRFTGKRVLWTDGRQRTNVPGVYAAGDASRDVQLVVVATAEGAKAAIAINGELQDEDHALDLPAPAGAWSAAEV